MTSPSRSLYLTSPVLAGNDGIRHGFLTRAGGVSTGLYQGLNCGFGSGDEAASVRANRDRALTLLDLNHTTLLTCHQVHSPDAVEVRDPWTPETAPEADGMVSTRSDVALGILTADCAPVLFADPRNRVIGAAHAGWKGAISGITDKVIGMMVEKGAARETIAAAIGPTISQASYEVGAEFRERFVETNPENVGFFAPGDKDGKFQFDLPAYVAARLEQAGITRISVSDLDTCTDEVMFFSYRRSVHRGERDYGRGLSVIALAQKS